MIITYRCSLYTIFLYQVIYSSNIFSTKTVYFSIKLQTKIFHIYISNCGLLVFFVLHNKILKFQNCVHNDAASKRCCVQFTPKESSLDNKLCFLISIIYIPATFVFIFNPVSTEITKNENLITTIVINLKFVRKYMVVIKVLWRYIYIIMISSNLLKWISYLDTC